MHKTTLFCPIVALLFACGEAPQSNIDADSVQQAMLSDPANHVEINGRCLHKRRYGGVAGRIYFPPSAGCATMSFSPIVVLLPGAGYDFKTYNDYLIHLSRNGFVAISVNTLGTNASEHDQAVQDVITFLDGLRSSWRFRNFVDHSNMGLVGHSRGGGTVRHLAVALQNPVHTWTVKAIVGLASVDDGVTYVNSSQAEAVMLLHGAEDGDINADRSFQIYDRSGTEGLVFGNGVDRSMKLFEGGNHVQFTTKLTGTVTSVMRMTRGYLLAFFAAHLKDDRTWYEEYIRGDELIPDNWSSGRVANQFSDGGARNVIDNFEDGNVQVSTQGQPVDRINVIASNVDLAGQSSLFHDTRALRMAAFGGIGQVTWRIPTSSQNAGLYKYLSLRIGQTGAGQPPGLSIQIRNGNVWSSPLPLANYGVIAEAMSMCVVGNYSTGGCPPDEREDINHMSTIRVPLSAFGAYNDVERVRITLGGDTFGRQFYLDSLEFSEWILSP